MDPFIGEIRIFAGTYAPVNWSFCNGSALAIRQYEAFYALIGVIYGGDGVNDFKIPDLRSRVPIHMGQGNALNISHALGSKGGAEAVTLTVAQVPAHNHTLNATTAASNTEVPTGTQVGAVSGATQFISANAPSLFPFPMSSQMVSSSGGTVAHSNVMPTMALNYIIALNGLFPTNN